MATTVPYRIDNEDLEKYAKQVLANNVAADRSKLNRHDIGFLMGQMLAPQVRRVDNEDIAKFIKLSALV
jgi:Asp-tRNA(Asn)/Glu-tRNA(Gln) amidotransferase B subunit